MSSGYIEKAYFSIFDEPPVDESQILPPMDALQRYSLATKLAGSMVRKHALPSGDFLFIPSATDTEDRLAVVYAAERGIAIGGARYADRPLIGWRDVSSTVMNGDFYISDGLGLRGKRKEFDTRSGMTRETYAAMIRECKLLRKPLPDNQNFDYALKGKRTSTLLTGHLYPHCVKAFLAHTYGERLVTWPLVDDETQFLFRPSVIIRSRREG